MRSGPAIKLSANAHCFALTIARCDWQDLTAEMLREPRPEPP